MTLKAEKWRSASEYGENTGVMEFYAAAGRERVSLAAQHVLIQVTWSCWSLGRVLGHLVPIIKVTAQDRFGVLFLPWSTGPLISTYTSHFPVLPLNLPDTQESLLIRICRCLHLSCSRLSWDERCGDWELQPPCLYPLLMLLECSSSAGTAHLSRQEARKQDNSTPVQGSVVCSDGEPQLVSSSEKL